MTYEIHSFIINQLINKLTDELMAFSLVMTEDRQRASGYRVLCTCTLFYLQNIIQQPDKNDSHTSCLFHMQIQYVAAHNQWCRSWRCLGRASALQIAVKTQTGVIKLTRKLYPPVAVCVTEQVRLKDIFFFFAFLV